MTFIAAIILLALCALMLAFVLSILGFAIGIAADIVALAFKLLPLALVVLVVLFFVQGGKVSRGPDGNVNIDLPDSWHKRS